MKTFYINYDKKMKAWHLQHEKQNKEEHGKIELSEKYKKDLIKKAIKFCLKYHGDIAPCSLRIQNRKGVFQREWTYTADNDPHESKG